MKRVKYTSSCKRRVKVISHLEKHNAEILMLLGNSEKLVPMRKKRKSPVTKYFRQIRSQAQNLHTVLNRAWQCEDSSAHSSKFLLEKRLKFDENSSPEIEDPSIIKFNVFFCYEPQKRASMSHWFLPHRIGVQLRSRCWMPIRISNGNDPGQPTWEASRHCWRLRANIEAIPALGAQTHRIMVVEG